MFKLIAAALAVSSFTIAAHAESIPAACKPMVKAAQVCSLSMLEAAKRYPGVSESDLAPLEEAAGPNGFKGQIQEGVREKGAAVMAANCSKPEIRANTVQTFSGIAASINMMGGDAGPCLNAVSEMQ
jgi:hypothetical protein